VRFSSHHLDGPLIFSDVKAHVKVMHFAIGRLAQPGNESLSFNIIVHADAENVLEFYGAASPPSR